MNLRDKLKAIEKPKSPPKVPEKQFTDCYHGREMRELSEFPGAFDLDLSALHLNPKQRIRIFNNSRIVFQRKFRLPKYGKQWHSKHCIPWKF